jgi:osmotically-inducible protein OsmY
MKTILSGLALASLIAMCSAAQTPAPAKQAAKAKKATAAKSDSEIESCITQKLAAAPKLKDQGFSAAVSGGVVTLTGSAINGGSKGDASKIAKSCGAKQVVNNITVQPHTKPAAKKH